MVNMIYNITDTVVCICRNKSKQKLINAYYGDWIMYMKVLKPYNCETAYAGTK